jgi:hypothetical protein
MLLAMQLATTRSAVPGSIPRSPAASAVTAPDVAVACCQRGTLGEDGHQVALVHGHNLGGGPQRGDPDGQLA